MSSIEECKSVIAETIRQQIADGTRKANIEIDLIHFIKNVLYGEANQ
ncbi:MAG: hypothetical protein ACQEXB_24440 [Bacillota bacterium]